MQRSVRILETWKQKLKAAMDRWARSDGGDESLQNSVGYVFKKNWKTWDEFEE